MLGCHGWQCRLSSNFSNTDINDFNGKLRMSNLEPPRKKAKILHTPSLSFAQKPVFKLPPTIALRSPASFKARNDFKSTFRKENIGSNHASAGGSPLKTPLLPFPIATSKLARKTDKASPLASSAVVNSNLDGVTRTPGAFSVSEALLNPFIPNSPSPKPIPKAVRVLQPPLFEDQTSTIPRPLRVIGPPTSLLVAKPITPARVDELQELSHPPNYAYSRSDTSHINGEFVDGPPLQSTSSYYFKEITNGLQTSPRKRDSARGWGGERSRKFVRCVCHLLLLIHANFYFQQRLRNGLAERLSAHINNSDTAFMFWRKEIQREPPMLQCPSGPTTVVDSLRSRFLSKKRAQITVVDDSPIRNSHAFSPRQPRGKAFRLPPEEFRVRIEEVIGSVPSYSHLVPNSFHTKSSSSAVAATSDSGVPSESHLHSMLTRCRILTKSKVERIGDGSDGVDEGSDGVWVVFKCLSRSAAYATLPVAFSSRLPELEMDMDSDSSLLNRPLPLDVMTTPSTPLVPTNGSSSVIPDHPTSVSESNPITEEAVKELTDTVGSPHTFVLKRKRAESEVNACHNEDPVVPESTTKLCLDPSRDDKMRRKSRAKLSSSEHLHVGREVLVWKSFVGVLGSGSSSELGVGDEERPGEGRNGESETDFEHERGGGERAVEVGDMGGLTFITKERKGSNMHGEGLKGRTIFCTRFLVVR